MIEAGQKAFFNDDTNKCSTCHTIEARIKDDKTGKFLWEKQGDVTAPDLTSYGSAEWIRGMIMSPGHKSRYGEKNLMPSFRNRDGPGSEVALQDFLDANPATKVNSIQDLSDIDREMIIRWILRDYRPIYGGATISK